MTRNPIAKAVRMIRARIKPAKKDTKLDAAVDKITHYILEHPETKQVFERLKDR